MQIKVINFEFRYFSSTVFVAFLHMLVKKFQPYTEGQLHLYNGCNFKTCCTIISSVHPHFSLTSSKY